MDNNSQTNYAGFWIRWFAQGIDIIIWLVNLLVAFYLLSAFGSSGIQMFIPSFLWFLLYVIFVAGILKFFVQPWLISRLGGGPGKLACGLEITKEDGGRLTYKNAMFRENISKIASKALFGLGYYWIFRNPQRQAWHDSLAGTYVVKKHNGFLTGLMVLILFLAIEGGLAYKSVNNFKNNISLQYDFITLFTQIRQDLSKSIEPNTVEVNPDFNNAIEQIDDYIVQ